MEQMKNKDQQKMLMDEIDYIDIPAFVRSMKRYARKYILFVVPLILCMSACLAMFTKQYTKKHYVAGGTSIIGIRLSDSLSFDYTLSGLTWDRESTLMQLNYVFSGLLDSGYITQYVKDSMGKKRDEELDGQIYMNAVYSTNLIDIYVVSELPEDAAEIRDAVFDCLPDAVFPAVGFIEMDIQEMYTREESSPRAFLATPVVWGAGGVVLGIIGYLGLVFLYTLRRRDVETPYDLRKFTDLPCVGRLPALKKKEQYQRAFESFRRTVAEEIRQHQIKVLLLTGSGHRKGQSTIAAGLEEAWSKMGKKVIRTDLKPEEGLMTEEKVRGSLNQYLEEADIILIDGPS